MPRPLTAAEVRARLLAKIVQAGGLRALARDWDVDVGQLSRQLRSDSDLVPPILLDRLGLRAAEPRYLPK